MRPPEAEFRFAVRFVGRFVRPLGHDWVQPFRSSVRSLPLGDWVAVKTTAKKLHGKTMCNTWCPWGHLKSVDLSPNIGMARKPTTQQNVG